MECRDVETGNKETLIATLPITLMIGTVQVIVRSLTRQSFQ